MSPESEVMERNNGGGEEEKRESRWESEKIGEISGAFRPPSGNKIQNRQSLSPSSFQERQQRSEGERERGGIDREREGGMDGGEGGV